MKKIKLEDIRFVATLKIRIGGVEWETSAGKPFFVKPHYGDAFTITEINIYQGKKGEEILTKIIPVKN